MPLELIADTETDGFLDKVTKLHSIVLRDAPSGEIVLSCADQPGYRPLADGLAMMEKADLLIGHNWITYDAPVLAKLRPDFRPRGKVFDSLVASRLAWPVDRLKDEDFKLQKKGKLPTNMIGRHSIEAWGYRLGVAKVGTDITDWSAWTPYMHERCEGDTKVNWLLYKALIAQGVPADVMEMEHQVAAILARQERRGFYFDMKLAEDLQRDLQKRQAELDDKLRAAFKPWEVRTSFTPKVNNKKMGYVKGVPTEKVKTIVFNPASRDHIADRLVALRGWKPKAFTNTGKPQVDESTIGELNFPEAKLLTEYLMVGKRLGQLCEGKEALMKHVKEDGRIHGSVNPNGANTYRMTHSRPNMAQVPSLRAAFGKQFRALLMAGTAVIDGVLIQYVLVGADADALELRCLAGYMAAYDGGAYIKTVLEGKKEDGTDIHSVNARALGLDPARKYPIDGQQQSGRDIAKVWFYAFIYGAGDVKLGEILGIRGSAVRQKKAGASSRASFLKALPALDKLVNAVKAVLKTRGHLNAIDKRKLYARSEHAALNTLLQSAGAIFMKYALVILDEALQAAGLVPGVDYEFVANVHDEWQIETKEEHAEFIGQQACASIVTAGERLRFRCPLAGAFSTGKSWASTH